MLNLSKSSLVSRKLIAALVVAAASISASRLHAAQPGTLRVVNANHASPVVIDWAPIPSNGGWQRLPVVGGGWEMSFQISLPDGALGIAVRADSNDETIEQECIEGTDYYYEPYP